MVKQCRKLREMKGPSSREVSLKSITCFAGTVKELLDRTAKGELFDGERSCSTVGLCPALEITQGYFTMKGVVPIWHSPRGCPLWICYMDNWAKGYKKIAGEPLFHENIISTDLTSNEIVYGGENRLQEVILWVDKKYKPELIPILCTCAPGVVGDDIDSAVESIQDKVNAKILPFHCEGFRSKVWGTGFDIGVYGLVYNVMEEPRKKEKDLVNIPIPWTGIQSEILEMNRILGKLGIRARYIPRVATVEDLRRAPEAVANLLYCITYGYPWVAYMEERFGTPWPEEALQTYGIDHAHLWVRGAARMVDKEKLGEKVIKEEDEELMRKIEPLKRALKGKTIWCDGSHARAPALARVFGELGMKVVGLSVYSWDILVNPILEAAIEYIGEDVPAIIQDINMVEIGGYLKKIKPDLFIGDLGMSYHALRLGIPSLCIQANDNTGCHSLYRGAYNLAREAVLAIEMGSYPRSLGRHISMFSDEWIKGEPHRFMPPQAIGFPKC